MSNSNFIKVRSSADRNLASLLTQSVDAAYSGALTAINPDSSGNAFATLNYSIVGNVVTIHIPSIVPQTAFLNDLLHLALPTALVPSTSPEFVVRVDNNAGTNQFGLCVVDSGNSRLSFSIDADQTAFTAASGQVYETSITYRL